MDSLYKDFYNIKMIYKEIENEKFGYFLLFIRWRLLRSVDGAIFNLISGITNKQRFVCACLYVCVCVRKCVDIPA